MTDTELQKLMFSKESKVSASKKMPDYAYIRKELLRNGVTKKLLWTEYIEDCRANGEEPLMYSQFCYHIQQDEQKYRATMHVNRKSGEQIEVGWAGDPATIIDPDTGEILKSYIFRELMGNYLKENNVKVKDGTDVNSIMRDMMSIILEGALDQELDEELGYSKYDYRNKETDNSRNGHSQKTLHTSYGDMEIDIPRDRKGDFEPQVVKKYQNSITQDMEEKIISMYAKGMTTADIESHIRHSDIKISFTTHFFGKIQYIGIK